MTAAKKRIGPYLLSFLKQVQVETTSSEFTHSLEVVLFEGRYMLNTQNATYSYEDKYSSYKSALQHIAKDLPTMKSGLVLGLGLGSIPYMLQRNFNFTGQIDCVEIDATIIDLASKYYPSSKLFNQLKIHEADALNWMEFNHRKFDLITVDLFIDKYVPREFHSATFMELLKQALNPNGILLFSRMTDNTKSEKQLGENLKNIFPEGEIIDTGGNLIFCFKNRNS